MAVYPVAFMFTNDKTAPKNIKSNLPYFSMMRDYLMEGVEIEAGFNHIGMKALTAGKRKV